MLWLKEKNMANVAPRPAAELPELAGVFGAAEAAMGFVPNSMLTMAHMPQLPMAFVMLTSVVFGGDLKSTVDAFKDSVPEHDDPAASLAPGLVQLIALASSVSAGCRYCQAHTAHGADKRGEDAAKLDALLAYETSELYSQAERAVLALAFAAGQVPNEAQADHFAALREHFSERQIVQIVAVIAMFGFLNRWNDTMATTLEAAPVAFAEKALGALDWSAGKHG